MDHEDQRAVLETAVQQHTKSQQRQIDELVTVVTELQARVCKLETLLAQVSRDGRSASTGEEFRAQELAVRDALRHLNDVSYLAECRLAQMATRLCGNPLDGLKLRHALIQAIHKMEFAKNSNCNIRSSRHYDVLRLAYLDRQRPEEIAATLAIGERQYYRDLKAAIYQVVKLILED
jgi:hypothetical protein